MKNGRKIGCFSIIMILFGIGLIGSLLNNLRDRWFGRSEPAAVVSEVIREAPPPATDTPAQTTVSRTTATERITTTAAPETTSPPETTVRERTSPPEKTTTGKQDSSLLSGAVTPSFKKMMDSYEAFFDKYIAFMKKYENSDDTLAMMGEYFDWLAQYADYMEKLSEAEDEALTDADALYYTEVQLRIAAKLYGMANN